MATDPLPPVHEDDPYYAVEQWSEYDAAHEKHKESSR